jgi:hypothetical protein
MKSNKSTIFWVIGIVVILTALFLYPRFTAPKNGNGVALTPDLSCLLPNLPELQHFHPHLQILVDNKEETIPTNIGLLGSCHRPLHTHGTDGIIHVESQVVKDYTLGQFFKVWGKSIEREGYILETILDAKLLENPADLVLKDGQKIVFKYVSVGK